MLDFSTKFGIYCFQIWKGDLMIDNYDSEALVKAYRLLIKKCDAIDNFIENHALYFGPCTADYTAEDVYNNIIELIERKNQLINLKIIVDSAMKTLSENDRKVLYMKIYYNISMSEFCGIFNLKERTAFRRIEAAYSRFAQALNNSKYALKLERIIDKEEWIKNIREEVKEYRQAFKSSAVNSL